VSAKWVSTTWKPVRSCLTRKVDNVNSLAAVMTMQETDTGLARRT